MSVEAFFDTNILLYAYDLDAGSKRSKAVKLLEKAWKTPERYALSVQVLQEFTVNFISGGGELTEARELLTDLCQFQVIESTVEVFGLGLALQERWQLSHWDAMILSAAQIAGARTLYTEDFNNGQAYGTSRAINPFRKRV